MNWKTEQLIKHMVEWDVDPLGGYTIYVPGEGRVVIAEDTTEDDPRYRRRQVEQVELLDDGSVVVVMEKDYDNPINDVTNIKFEIHEAVYVIG